MESNSLITIIVPVYNVSSYLSDCILSLSSQTYQNIQIILINDGSTDDSGLICDQAAKKDRRIEVVHKSNEGQGKARNIGLDNAKGRYVMFCDADDWYESNMVKSLLSSIQREAAQLAICGRKSHQAGKLIYVSSVKDEVLNINSLSLFLVDRFFNPFTVSTCNKLYNLDIIRQKSIYFKDVSYVGSEDTLFNIAYLQVINRVVSISSVFYCTNIRLDSTVHTFNPGYLNRLLNLTKEVSKLDNMDKNTPILVFVFYLQFCLSKLKEFSKNNSNVVEQEFDLLLNKQVLNKYIWQLCVSPNLKSLLFSMGYRSTGIIYLLFCLVMIRCRSLFCFKYIIK